MRKNNFRARKSKALMSDTNDTGTNMSQCLTAVSFYKLFYSSISLF